MSNWSLLGRRVLAIGDSLAPLARGPLFGAAMEVAGLDRLTDLRAGMTDLILIDADHAEPAALAAAVATLAGVADLPPTLFLGGHLPVGLVRALMRLPHADVVEAPFTHEQLQNAIYALLDQAAAQAPSAQGHHSRCWSVLGAVGGAGATMAAIEIASALAARSNRANSVCLIDLHLADGACAPYLGATAATGRAALCTAAARLNSTLISSAAPPVAKGLDLLACPRDPGAFSAISREAVLRILEIACEAYDHVVLDMPRHRHSWSLDALTGSDEVVVVSELTVPALLAARALSEEIEAAANVQPRIVLNRLANRMFGPAPSTAEAEKALQRKADGGIASDWEAAAASVNLGGAISQHRPKSKIVRDVGSLVDRLLADHGRRPAPFPAAASSRAA
ncbi:CpaE family protein [soil metagenome]